MNYLYTDFICFSHLRWDFIFQRPHHLLSRFAKHHRVYFIEEPIFDAVTDWYEVIKREDINVWTVVMHLKADTDLFEIELSQKKILLHLCRSYKIKDYVLWFYSPMALPISKVLDPILTVYDCMDELSAFKFASPKLKQLEAELMRKADIVFTGGRSLYEAKRRQHEHIYLFPSSIDKAHFLSARRSDSVPDDQEAIPSPRLGYCGFLDERLNLALIEEISSLKKDWQLVFLGPIVKIDPASLPQAPNIHYLGKKEYSELPAYISGWDICLMPFALNEFTEYINPSKMPEYLAAGKPVISTSIRDVVEPYGRLGLVHIADSASGFVDAAVSELEKGDKRTWLESVDEFLSKISWDKTWEGMDEIMQQALHKKNRRNVLPVTGEWIIK